MTGPGRPGTGPDRGLLDTEADPEASTDADRAAAHRRPWLGWVLIGFLGCCLIAPLPIGDGFLPRAQETWIAEHVAWLRHRTGRVLLRLLALAGALLTFAAWLRLRPGARGRGLRFGWAAVLWSLPFWLMPPLNTADPFAYAAQGWLLDEGLNPYTVPMGHPGPFTDTIYPAWRDTTAVYPPLALQLQRLVVMLCGADPYWSVVGMRLLAMAGFLVMVGLSGPLARAVLVSPRTGQWAIGLNPLVLTQFVGGAHNDALMVAGVMFALWLGTLRPGRRSGIALAAVGIGLAAAIKQPAILAAPGVIWFARHGIVGELPGAGRRPVNWWRAITDVLLGGVIAAAVFVATSIPDNLWFGWLGPDAGSPTLVINHSPLSWFARLAVARGVSAHPVELVVQAVSGVMLLVAAVWLLRRFGPRQPLRFTAGSLLAFGLLGPAIQTWYVLWGGPLLAFVRPSARLVMIARATVLLLTWSAILQDFMSPVIGLSIAAIPTALWLARGPLLRRFRRAPVRR